ncbi:hypothetical protein PC116_g17949 [Phytophthora cactorum]|uniref:Uncharacterized protein n=1 Tax=Phytophthora cactorum TaxID=29920 RepID=A0A8T1C1Z6_9STRA|nr:hypothetical protein PC114_g14773 [Phytophthora cactorum]KAG2912936.1 hypothetical protein PC117_g18737 [Phytophthora cactorum]KAG3153958.1 hypothetical protein C6341_g15789 [Phytophthora cactorum]KAG4233875.1 hypothetical protein PC116_g17949 [Phytophthora cactorum]
MKQLAPRRAPKVMQLLEGESMGWWSSQRYGKRVWMCVMVSGAINDDSTGHRSDH